MQFKINGYAKKASHYKLAYRVTASVAAIGSAVVLVEAVDVRHRLQILDLR